MFIMLYITFLIFIYPITGNLCILTCFDNSSHLTRGRPRMERSSSEDKLCSNYSSF